MEMDIENDAFQLCTDALKVGLQHLNIAMDSSKQFKVDLTYSHPKTPYMLESENVLKIDEIITMDKIIKDGAVERLYLLDPKSSDFTLEGNLNFPKGFCVVAFDYKKARDWCKKVLERTSNKALTEVNRVPEGWKWFDKKLGKYQFGGIGIFEQKGKKRKTIFQHLIDLFEKSPKGISIQSLSQRTGVKPERLRIEINAINNRLEKYSLYFKGTGKGFYILQTFSDSPLTLS